MVGLDTTVDQEAGLDFQFKNDTSANLLIQTSTDGTNVHFALYGIPPSWKVRVDQPVITNLVKTDPKVVVQDDATMPKGQQVYTEAAQDGFTVTIRRTVTDVAGDSRQLNLRSNYAPAHNVIAVGTRV
jgi:vancomycin resistance protein YoaR